MNFSSTSERSYWLILVLSTFLAVVGFSVSIWSIGSLKYQIKYSKSLEDKLISLQQSSKDQIMILKKSISQLNSTFKRQNKKLGEHFSQIRSTVHQLAS